MRAAGVESTVIRASWFAQNFSEHFLLEAVRDGVIALPAGDVAEPFIDVDDIADIAVAALTEDGHAGEVYEVTGPRLLTFADVAAELTLATGREIRYLAVSRRRSTRPLAVEQGVPADEVEALTELFDRVLDGRNAVLTDDVRRALGRPARDFADYAAAAAASGVWDVPAGGRPMRTGVTGTFTVVAATGAGVVGGVFFAFSTFVMRALRGLPDRDGLAAMQAINKAAPSPLFLTALLGTGVVSVGLAVSAATRLDEPGAPYQLVGSALYLTAVVLTIVYHVPRNDGPGPRHPWPCRRRRPLEGLREELDGLEPRADRSPRSPAPRRSSSPSGAGREATSRPAQPSGQSRPAQPSGQSRPAQPSGQSRPAQPSGQSRQELADRRHERVAVGHRDRQGGVPLRAEDGRNALVEVQAHAAVPVGAERQPVVHERQSGADRGVPAVGARDVPAEHVGPRGLELQPAERGAHRLVGDGDAIAPAAWRRTAAHMSASRLSKR